MSKYTPQGVLKAKHNPHYRDPKFFGGLCCVCKKRARNYRHEHYPHMCDKCRESRVFSRELPFTNPEVARAIKEYDYKVHGGSVPRVSVQVSQTRALSQSDREVIQTLNRPTELTLQQRIAESAARFRATVKK